MTKAQADELRVKGKQRVDAPACEHPNQKLELSEGGYLTGNYHCLDCGESVPLKPQ